MWHSLHDIVTSQLENQFFSGGALIVILTGFLASLRHLPEKIWSLLKRHLVTVVDVSDSDQSFYWIQNWLSKHTYMEKARLLTLTTKTAPSFQAKKKVGRPVMVDKLPRIILSPATGQHLIFHKGSFILLERERRKSEMIGEVPHSDTFVLQSFSKEAIQNLIKEARYQYFPSILNTQIWKPLYYDWALAQEQPPRSFESIVLPDAAVEELQKDLDWFLGAKEWYLSLGIPYRRGYLLYGPPGNGKTSIVSALAGRLERDLYILSLAGLDDSSLMSMMIGLPEHSILLVEDVDCVATGRDIQADGDKLTFSGFLNAIDGIGAAEGRILIMTTNHPEKLDPALIRPGRVDRRCEFPNATEDTACRMFLRFFPGHEAEAVIFGGKVASSTTQYSMAMLQEHLIGHRDSPSDASQLE